MTEKKKAEELVLPILGKIIKNRVAVHKVGFWGWKTDVPVIFSVGPGLSE